MTIYKNKDGSEVLSYHGIPAALRKRLPKPTEYGGSICVMGDKVRVEKDISHVFHGDVESVISGLKVCAEGLASTYIEYHTEATYYDEYISKFILTGLRKMTAEELEAVDDLRTWLKKKAATEAAKRKKARETAERKEYEKLKAKFEKSEAQKRARKSSS